MPTDPLGRLLAAGFLALAAGGCSDRSAVDPLPRRAVSGTVTLDGQPLPAGIIRFDPEARETGVPVVGDIKDGRFAIGQPQGPVPGKYRVLISGWKADNPESAEAGPRAKPGPGAIRKAELEAQVTPEGPNSFNFAMPKKP